MSDDQLGWLSKQAIIAEHETGTTFDLSACVREPIHRLGFVQSYGALVGVRETKLSLPVPMRRRCSG